MYPLYSFVDIRSITWFDISDKSVEGASEPLAHLSGSLQYNQLSAYTVIGDEGQALLVTLITDSNFNLFTGFKAKVTSSWRDCYHAMEVNQLVANKAVSFSDGYAIYPVGLALCWVFVPPPGKFLVKLDFVTFNTELGFDLVEVNTLASFDAPTRRYVPSRSLGNFSGVVTPGVVSAEISEPVLVRFRSDYSIGAAGFTATATAVNSISLAPTLAPTTAPCGDGLLTYASSLLAPFPINFAQAGATKRCFSITPEDVDTTVVSLQFLELGLGAEDYIRIIAISNALVPSGITVKSGRLIKSIQASTFVPSKVYRGKIGETVIVVLMASVGPVEISAMVKSVSAKSAKPTQMPSKAHPSSPECSSSMDVFEPFSSRFIISEEFPDVPYANDYHSCVVVKSRQDSLTRLDFSFISIADDSLQVFAVDSFNVATKMLGVKSHVEVLNETSETMFTAPFYGATMVISLRTNFGNPGGGYRAEASAVDKQVSCTSLIKAKAVPFPGGTTLASGILAPNSKSCWILTQPSKFYNVLATFSKRTKDLTVDIFNIDTYDLATASFTATDMLGENPELRTSIIRKTAKPILVTASVSPTAAVSIEEFTLKALVQCTCSVQKTKPQCSQCGACRWSKSGFCFV
jgi:hypothetical protein